jgi:hypothetical protein
MDRRVDEILRALESNELLSACLACWITSPNLSNSLARGYGTSSGPRRAFHPAAFFSPSD